MKKNKFSLLLLLFIFTLVIQVPKINAQGIDSPLSALDPAKEYKTKFIFSFDSRVSFLLDHQVELNGLKFGIQFKKNHRVGMSFHLLKNPVLIEIPGVNKHNIAFDFNYLSIFYEYILFKNRRWEFSTPLYLGIGDLNVTLADSTGKVFKNSSGNPIFTKNLPVYTSELSFVTQYNILKWLGIAGGIGYRKVWSEESSIAKVTSSPAYSLKLKIYLGVIYRGIKRKIKSKKNDLHD